MARAAPPNVIASSTQEPAWRGRIGIIGAGALGGFYGARLMQSGADVHFLMRGDYEAVRRNGLCIHSIDGDFEVRPPVYRAASELGPCDLLIIGLKSTDNAALPELLRPTVAADTLVLTLQNGFGNEEAIADIIGAPDRVLGGTAFLCSNRIGPGVIDHSAHGWVRLAEFSGAARPRTRAIAAMFRAARIACEVYDSLLRARWEKLVWNIPFNGLGVAAHHADTAVVLGSEPLANAARGLMREVLDAARGDGIDIDPAFIDAMMLATTSMGPYKSSMQLDHEAGRPLEVEAILGEPLRRARRAGVSTPRLEMLYGIVRRLAPE